MVAFCRLSAWNKNLKWQLVIQTTVIIEDCIKRYTFEIHKSKWVYLQVSKLYSIFPSKYPSSPSPKIPQTLYCSNVKSFKFGIQLFLCCLQFCFHQLIVELLWCERGMHSWKQVQNVGPVKDGVQERFLQEECLNLTVGSRGGYLAGRQGVEEVTDMGRAHGRSRALSRSWREPGRWSVQFSRSVVSAAQGKPSLGSLVSGFFVFMLYHFSPLPSGFQSWFPLREKSHSISYDMTGKNCFEGVRGAGGGLTCGAGRQERKWHSPSFYRAYARFHASGWAPPSLMLRLDWLVTSVSRGFSLMC